MEKKNQTLKNKLKILFTKLYQKNSTTIITICWIVVSLHLTMISKYQNCINYYDEKSTVIFIFWLFLGIMFLVFILIIKYFITNRNIIREKSANAVQEPLSGMQFGNDDIKIFILPMYLLYVFSLSKLIVISYQSFINGVSVDIIVKIIILLIILGGSLWTWLSFKKFSTKSWSLWATIFAISYVIINIFWEYFLPFMQSYLSTLNCIFKTITTK